MRLPARAVEEEAGVFAFDLSDAATELRGAWRRRDEDDDDGEY
jgi:hypothetical protein